MPTEILYPIGDVSSGNIVNNDNNSAPLWSRINNGVGIDSYVDVEFVKLSVDSPPRAFEVDTGAINMLYPTGLYINLRGRATVNVDCVYSFKDNGSLAINNTAGLSSTLTNSAWNNYTVTDTINETNRSSFDLSNTSLNITLTDIGPGFGSPLPQISEVEVIVQGTGIGGVIDTITGTIPAFISKCESALLIPDSGLPYPFLAGNKGWFTDACSSKGPSVGLEIGTSDVDGPESLAAHFRRSIMHTDFDNFVTFRAPASSGGPISPTGQFFTLPVTPLSFIPSCHGVFSIKLSGVAGSEVTLTDPAVSFQYKNPEDGNFENRFLWYSGAITKKFIREEVSTWNIPLTHQPEWWDESVLLYKLGTQQPVIHSDFDLRYTQNSGDFRIYSMDVSAYGGSDQITVDSTTLYTCGSIHQSGYKLVPEVIDPSGDHYRFRGDFNWSGVFNEGFWPIETGIGGTVNSAYGVGPSGQMSSNCFAEWYDGWKRETIGAHAFPTNDIHTRMISSNLTGPIDPFANGIEFDTVGTVFDGTSSYSVYTSIVKSGNSDDWDNNMVWGYSDGLGTAASLEFNTNAEPVFTVYNDTLLSNSPVTAVGYHISSSEYLDIISMYDSSAKKSKMYIRRPEQKKFTYFESSTDFSPDIRADTQSSFILGSLDTWSPFIGYTQEMGWADRLITSGETTELALATRLHPVFIDQRHQSPTGVGGPDNSIMHHHVPNITGAISDSIKFELSDLSESFLNLDAAAGITQGSQIGGDSIIMEMWVKNETDNSGGLTIRGYMPGIGWSGVSPVINSGSYTKVSFVGDIISGGSGFYDQQRNEINNTTIVLDLSYADQAKSWSAEFDVYNVEVSLDAWWKPPTVSNLMTAFISGPTGTPINSGTTLFIHGASGVNNNPTLFINGLSPDSGELLLYTQGAFLDNGNIPLFIHGKAADSGFMNLYIKGTDFRASNTTDSILFTFGATPGSTGLYDNTTLFIRSDIISTGRMNLFTEGWEPPKSDTNTMNLFLKGLGDQFGFQKFTSTTPLFLQNNTVQNNSGIKLVMWNQQAGESGSVPVSGFMNLFINRPFESRSHNFPMFIAGPSGYSDTMPLFMQGLPNTRSGVDMFIDGIGSTTQPITLYGHGF